MNEPSSRRRDGQLHGGLQNCGVGRQVGSAYGHC
jgi:hypothetical protein